MKTFRYVDKLTFRLRRVVSRLAPPRRFRRRRLASPELTRSFSGVPVKFRRSTALPAKAVSTNLGAIQYSAFDVDVQAKRKKSEKTFSSVKPPSQRVDSAPISTEALASTSGKVAVGPLRRNVKNAPAERRFGRFNRNGSRSPTRPPRNNAVPINGSRRRSPPNRAPSTQKKGRVRLDAPSKTKTTQPPI